MEDDSDLLFGDQLQWEGDQPSPVCCLTSALLHTDIDQLCAEQAALQLAAALNHTEVLSPHSVALTLVFSGGTHCSTR